MANDMYLWNVLFYLSFFAVAVHSDGGSLVEPCLMKDIECLSKSTEKFLEQTCNGIKNTDIRAIDPLVIPSLDIDVETNMGIKFRFTNLNVTGLRNQKISEFQMSKETKKVVLQTKADLHITGDITIELTKEAVKLSGIYYADSSVLNTAQYSYNLKTDDTGVEHFEVGPETIECESVTEPIVSVSPELQTALNTDAVAKTKLPEYTANAVTFRKKVVCAIAKIGYGTVIHNIRAAAKILPKTAFFKDV